MIGRIKLKGGKKVDINGIIEQYEIQAGNNISAGDFVEFVNGNVSTESSTMLYNTMATKLFLSATALNSNKVFVAFYAYNSSNHYVEGIVCTIEGTTITPGVSVTLDNNTDTIASGKTYCIALNENKVFVLYRKKVNNNYLFKAVVCSIEGTTITVGTPCDISGYDTNDSYASVSLLNENKVFIVYGDKTYSSGYTYTYMAVCTISGTTITKGTATALDQLSHYPGVSITLSENKVLVIWAGTYLYSAICTISGTTITKGTKITISSSRGVYTMFSAILLENNKVFITKGKQVSSKDYPYGIVCTIEGTTITPGVETQLVTNTKTTIYGNTIAKLSNNKVFIVDVEYDSVNSVHYAYSTNCMINGTTITVSDKTLLQSDEYNLEYPLVTLNEYKLFTPYKNGISRYLYGEICIIEKLVSGFSKTINGVAKEDGTSGMTIDVTVPNV